MLRVTGYELLSVESCIKFFSQKAKIIKIKVVFIATVKSGPFFSNS